MKIAVIGSGIAGLSAAWLLANKHQVTVFEANHYAGGHSNAVDVELDGQQAAVDTGFLVFNEKTYPNLIQLFSLLNLTIANTDMSFSVRLNQENLEWAGSNLASLFAQKRNIVRPKFWQMINAILRFNRQALPLLALAKAEQLSLGQLLHQEKYSQAFKDWYLLPMGAAIWSTPSADMLDFPAESFIQFCLNHGLLQISDRPQWLTIKGSSRQYVKQLCAGIGDVRLNTPVIAVSSHEHGVHIQTEQEHLSFDKVILACHTDQSLALLQSPTPEQHSLLSAIRYAPNQACLHTDSSVMPKNRQAWAAWNYAQNSAQDTHQAVAVTYWLNKLQPLPFTTPLFVTLNPCQPIDEQHILQRFDYAHPQLDAAAYQAQQRLAAIQGKDNLYFCGAWASYGFHEDGLKSGMRVAKLLGADIPWQAVLD